MSLTGANGAAYYSCVFADIDHIQNLNFELKAVAADSSLQNVTFDKDTTTVDAPTFVAALAELPKANITAVVQAPFLTAGDNTSPVQYTVRACFV